MLLLLAVVPGQSEDSSKLLTPAVAVAVLVTLLLPSSVWLVLADDSGLE